MRIAILGCRGIPARYGGFETFAEGLGVRLVERGHVVTVYCEGRRRGRPRSFKGVHLVYIPVPMGGCLRPLVYDLFSLLHASLGHDVVYLLGYGAALFGFIPRLLGRAFWVNMDGLEWKRSKWSPLACAWFKTMERVAMGMANRVVFDAEAVRDDLVKRHGQPAASVVLAYAAELSLAPPDAALLVAHKLRVDEYHLIVCRLEPENHVLEIVQGFVRSGARRPLVIVADSSCGSAYAQRCLEAGGECVRWIGTIWNRAQLAALRAGATSYAHGHSVGGTNPSLLEAMASGNLCLAHDNPFNREVLGDKALYFEHADQVAEGFRAIEEFSAAERRAFGSAGRARVVERYGWEQLANSYAALLEGSEVTPQSVESPELNPRRAATQGISGAAPLPSERREAA